MYRPDASTLIQPPDAPQYQRHRVRLAVIGSVRLYREGLATALARQEDIEVVGSLACHPSVVDRLSVTLAEVVLIDVAARDSLDTVHALRQKCPNTKVVAFAVDERDSGFVGFAEAGVAGYVTSDASLEELAEILRNVLTDQFVCPPSLTAMLLRHLAVRGGSSADHEALTPREEQVLRSVGDGLSNKEIAQAFNISEATVKNHVHHLLEKLHVRTRREAAARVRPYPR
jgi:two-component system nitrate/nitrite response regulator NarL